MIFLTVGTQFPFDRLVKAVDDIADEGVLGEEIFAQIGESSYRPRNLKMVSFIDNHLFDKYIHQASFVISHAGMGTIAAVLECGKPMLVMPRQRKYGEVVNDHQLGIVRKFEEMGHILVAYNEKDLVEKIKLLKTFVPKPRIPNRQGVIDRIESFLRTLENKHL
jgi:beta-1,4-N-acetylglucosaminyltransferase